MPNVCMHSGNWDNLLPLRKDDLPNLPIDDTPERANKLRQYYLDKGLDIWGICPKCGLVRLNKKGHIKQIIDVFGEKYQDVLFKKWTYHPDYRRDYSYVYLIEDQSPNINWNHIYDTKLEALEALKKEIQYWHNQEIEKIDKEISLVNQESNSFGEK